MAYEQTLPEVPATLWHEGAAFCTGFVTLTEGQRDTYIPGGHNSAPANRPGRRYRSATFRVEAQKDGFRLVAANPNRFILRPQDGQSLIVEVGSSSDYIHWTLNVRGDADA